MTTQTVDVRLKVEFTSPGSAVLYRHFPPKEAFGGGFLPIFNFCGVLPRDRDAALAKLNQEFQAELAPSGRTYSLEVVE